MFLVLFIHILSSPPDDADSSKALSSPSFDLFAISNGFCLRCPDKISASLIFFSVCRLVIGPPKRSERRHFLHTHLIETWWEFFRESFKWDWIDLGVLLILWGRWRLICDITITFTPALNLNALRRISLPCSHSVLYKGTPSLSKMCLSDTLTDYSLKKTPLTIQKKSPFFLWVINEWRKCLFLSSVNW